MRALRGASIRHSARELSLRSNQMYSQQAFTHKHQLRSDEECEDFYLHDVVLIAFASSGYGGIRTLYLLLARQAFSQVNYVPVVDSKRFELLFLGCEPSVLPLNYEPV